MSSEPSRSLLKRIIWDLVRVGVTGFAIWYVLGQITWKDRLIAGDRTLIGWVETKDGKEVFVTDKGREIALPENAEDPESDPRLVSGMIRIFRNVRLELLLPALALYPMVIFLSSVRWLWLLRCHALDPGIYEAMRLTWIGVLTNNVLPGATGGDVIKAVAISRRTPGQRTSAVMTVLLDRIIGLVALMLVGAVAILAQTGFGPIDATGQIVLLILGGVTLAGMIFFSRRIRSLFRVAAILDRIPLGHHIKRIDESLFHYRDHKMQLAACVLLSVFIHLWTLTLLCLMGFSLGMTVPVIYYYIFPPIIMTAGAVAPSIAGLGVLEGLFQHFFSGVGATASSAVALCILFRLMQLVGSLPGAVPLFAEFSAKRSVAPSNDADDEDVLASSPMKAAV